jgi:hypothetical protein
MVSSPEGKVGEGAGGEKKGRGWLNQHFIFASVLLSTKKRRLAFADLPSPCTHTQI